MFCISIVSIYIPRKVQIYMSSSNFQTRMSDVLMQLAQDTSRRRRIGGLTQRTLADELDVTMGTIQRQENDSYLSMNLRQFISLLKIMEEKNIDTTP